MDILTDVDHAQAAAHALPGAHSIWEIVLHMTSWKNEVRRRIGGAKPAVPLEGDWPQPPETPGAEAWANAMQALDAAHRALVAAVSIVRDEALSAAPKEPRDLEAGQGVTWYVLLHGLAQHDTYHSGQIALLKKGLTDAVSGSSRRAAR
jgi:uncharacterized damage-inducible protein DinB